MSLTLVNNSKSFRSRLPARWGLMRSRSRDRSLPLWNRKLTWSRNTFGSMRNYCGYRLISSRWRIPARHRTDWKTQRNFYRRCCPNSLISLRERLFVKDSFVGILYEKKNLSLPLVSLANSIIYVGQYKKKQTNRLRHKLFTHSYIKLYPSLF